MTVQVSNKVHLENCFINDKNNFASFDEIFEKNCFTLDCNLPHYYKILLTLKEICPVFNEYIFIITRNVDKLPITDKAQLQRTIVILIGDEWNRAPKYANKVALVYKSPGQVTKLAFHKNWLRFNIVVLAQYLRIWYKKLGYPNRKNVFSIPLFGYRYLPSLETKPFKERKYDMSFMGSISHNKETLIKKILKTPKILARTKLLSVLEKLKTKYNIYYKFTNTFPHANNSSEEEFYSEILMNTKICVSPRGTNLETFRYFEGLCYGCIIIAEEQPDYNYLEGSPAIILKSWDDLPKILENLYKNEALMESLHKKGMEYFAKKVDSPIIAEQMAKDIEQHYLNKQITILNKFTDSSIN